MTAKSKIFQAIDVLIGKARQTYYITPLNDVMQGRGKRSSACLASNGLVQLLQSQWPNKDGKMIGGGGTSGKSALGQALLGTGPIPSDWTEANRWEILMDVLTFRSFPSAVSFVAHTALSALSDTQVKTEVSRRWGKKAGSAFVAWHKATVAFLAAISEIDESSPAKHKKATEIPSLALLTGYNKEREAKRKAKPKASSRPVAPSPELIEAAEKLRKSKGN